MRIGENLSPFWQNIAAVLWVLGYGVVFVTAVSGLWGWYAVGAMACVVLVVSAIDERKAVKAALKGELRKADLVFAIYLLATAAIALAINATLAAFWLLASAKG
jgi:hypothetical protein